MNLTITEEVKALFAQSLKDYMDTWVTTIETPQPLPWGLEWSADGTIATVIYRPVRPLTMVTLTYTETYKTVSGESNNPEPEVQRTKPTTKQMFLKYGPGRRK